MGQESKQIQQGQEICWRDLTAEQMATLMADKGLLKKWEKLKERTNRHDFETWKEQINLIEKQKIKREDTFFRLNGQVMGVLAYFFAFIAAMNEKANGNLHQNLTAVDKIGEKYNLKFFCTGTKPEYDFEYYIGQIIPGSQFPKEKRDEFRKARCWERILGYLVDEGAPGCQNKVIEVFEWLRDKNHRNACSAYKKFACEVGGNWYVLDRPLWEENLIDSDSYESCLDLLDKWWKESGKALLNLLHAENNTEMEEREDK